VLGLKFVENNQSQPLIVCSVLIRQLVIHIDYVILCPTLPDVNTSREIRECTMHRIRLALLLLQNKEEYLQTTRTPPE